MPTVSIFDPPLPQTADRPIQWKNLYGASIAIALASILKATNQPILILVPDNLTLSRLMEELQFFLTNETPLLYFPDWETLPYDHFSPHQDIISDRLAVLNRLPHFKAGGIITTVTNLMQRISPKPYLAGNSFLFNVGGTLNQNELRNQLVHAGYTAVNQVREHGEFAMRGSIIDLYPMGSHVPFRIDLFDNEIDSIRVFSPETQLSLEKITHIHLLPAKEFPFNEESIELFRQQFREEFPGNPLKCPIYQDVSEGIASPGLEYYLPLFFKETATLFDYLPVNSMIISIGQLEKKAEDFWEEINSRYQDFHFDVTRPLLPPEKLFLAPQLVKTRLKDYGKIRTEHSETHLTFFTAHPNQTYLFETAPLPELDINHKATHPFQALQNFIQDYPGRILFCAETVGRREILLQTFKTISFHPTLFSSWQSFLLAEVQHGMVVAPLEQGFLLEEAKLAILTEAQLYGKRVMQRRLRKKNVTDPDLMVRNLTELQIGDPIVHIDHGVGRYEGLQTLKVGEQESEFLSLTYQGGDKLYVPVSSLHLIGRYSGADPENAPLHKLGNEQWQKIKRKAAEKVKDVAVELLDLYAKRAARPGFNYEISEDQYNAFAAQFPFEETPDQLQAIDQVFADMRSDKPMDRVICGDVGFGKTEVALRAAFIAVINSKQVLLLAPTTLLAQQHLQTFQDRFADWPIKIEMLSRFRTLKEQKKVLTDLHQGKVDIVIGTHKLLQKDIQVSSLGLIIIDEEHRFGVKQKEKLKALRSSVDILTLTATPIPRTLNMVLSGIRDLSVIATPPAKRLSVKTFVHEYRNHLIQEAIQREIMRGGQVYFLHNEVSTINQKAREITELVKEARVTVAHGQMHERDLETVMSKFYHRHFNVLVCSTIVESGIDIPTANTIIINRADKFGLAQLHQLRGRVGRSHHQAYAYLLIPERKYITDDAKKRLEAIEALDQLGIGFTLATHDLEIRGAGELLGESQSGDIEEIGFTLYMDLLSRAVDALKEGRTPNLDYNLIQHDAEIDLHLTALIPDFYLNDVQLRLQFYKRIASAKQESELDELQVEMIDRFGLLPEQLKTLFAITEIKLMASSIGICKLEANERSGKIEFNADPTKLQIKPETIIKLIQAPVPRYRLDGPTRLRFTLAEHDKKDRVALIRAILAELNGAK